MDISRGRVQRPSDAGTIDGYFPSETTRTCRNPDGCASFHDACVRYRAITVMALLVLTATVTSFVSSDRDRADASPPQDCFWSSVFDEENGNLFFPDTAVNYYLGRVSLPPGGELLLRGRFPHARYISFNLYDGAGRPTDALADSDIRPDRSSTNPFVGLFKVDRAGWASRLTPAGVGGCRPSVCGGVG